jgi:hypothetical protein
MSRSTLLTVAALTALCLSTPGQAQTPAAGQADEKAPAASRFALTIYSTADPGQFDPQQFAQHQRQNPYNPLKLPGYGVVRETRSIDLKAGLNTIRFTDVATGIDPTTVSFLSLTAPNATSVLEQSYEYDLVSSDKLLTKYLGKDITLTRKTGDNGAADETLAGTLLSFDSANFVLRTKDKDPVRIIPRSADITSIRLADLSAGLITKPTLVWQIDTNRAGAQKAQVTYQTDGLTWRADYNLILNADDTQADLGAWVSLLNESGASYPNTKLKLVAGDVQRLQPPQPAEPYGMRLAANVSKAGTGFAEKSFFEYHLYTLGRTTDLPDHSTKQIELFPSKSDIPVDKTYVYYGLPLQYRTFRTSNPYTDRDLGTQSNKEVDTYILFQNAEKNGLGIPLPAGRVRVYKRDQADEALEFIGEDLIQHTPKDEQVMVRLGSAFDIVGQRKQTNFTVDSNNHVITESFEITLRNHKAQPVHVLVKENLFRWSTWEITQSSDKYEKQDSRTIHIPVDVPANGAKTITYTVRYTW